MHIGICSPFDPHSIKDLIWENSHGLLSTCKGVPSTPVTPLVREWLKHGHSVSIYCLDPSVRSPIHFQGSSFSIYVFPKRRFRQCICNCYRTERTLIKDKIEATRPDILSAQWSYEHALAALDTTVPTVLTCHDTPLRYAWIGKNLFMTYHLGIAFRVIRKAKHLICVSPYTAEHIKKLFFPKGNVTVIPNGLPDETFGRGKKRISSMRPASSVFTLCSIGSWGNLKNIKALLKAYGMLREKHPDTRLVLFGSQLGCQEMAEKWAHTHHLDKGVEFRGFAAREQLLDFLEFEADLMVHPSKIETHGMVLIEAMACGVPVVAGEQSGAVAWTLDHGKSGILCNIRRPADIAHAIEQIILNPHAMREIIHHAWSSTYERFRIVDCASANEKILMEVAKTNISSPCE